MKKIKLSALFIFTSVFSLATASAELNSKPYSVKDIYIPTTQYSLDDVDFEKFKLYLTSQARLLGFDSRIISLIDEIKLVPRVIELDNKQVELRNKQAQAKPSDKVSYSIKDYLANHLSGLREARAKGFMGSHKEELNKISQKFGVPVQTIIGLWALESNFGNNQGKFDTLNSLASLAFEGRRRTLFTLEFFNALKIMQFNNLSKSEFKSSWAGALGHNQFLPSSYLQYGFDGNGDGKIDIWSNISDVMASIANYLNKEGWSDSYGWGTKVKLPENFNLDLAGVQNDKAKRISQWQELGVSFIRPKAITEQFFDNSDTKTYIVLPDRAADPAYLVTNNYKVYLKWNRSSYFAITNGVFSDQVIGFYD